MSVYMLAQLVGPAGEVIGVDMTEQQLAVAERHRLFHREAFGFDNVRFVHGYIERLEELELATCAFSRRRTGCLSSTRSRQRVKIMARQSYTAAVSRIMRTALLSTRITISKQAAYFPYAAIPGAYCMTPALHPTLTSQAIFSGTLDYLQVAEVACHLTRMQKRPVMPAIEAVGTLRMLSALFYLFITRIDLVIKKTRKYMPNWRMISQP
jgi:hypothetical protein